MNDSREWATSWLADLVGPEVPGTPLPVVVHDRQSVSSEPARLPEQLRELRRPIVEGVPKNGRYAVVHERQWNGRDAVWLEAAEYSFGMFGARLVLVQPVRRNPDGRLVADGEPVELAEDLVDGSSTAALGAGAGVTAGAVAASVQGGVRSAVDTLRRAGRSGGRSLRARAGRLTGLPTAVFVAVWVGVLLLGVVSAVSLTDLASSSRAAARSRVSERAAGQTAALRAAPAPAPAGAPAPGRATAHDPVPGDLGLPVPISRPPCDGGYGVIVANATRPGAYRNEIGGFLARYSGASYLLAEQACSSLRAHTESGNSIYAVYYGPYPALDNACATRRRVGGGSYIRKLDNGPQSSVIFRC